MEHGVVIVGGSIGGHNVASTLRKDGYEGPITMINQKGTLPYDVSKLSKDWMMDAEKDTPPLFKKEEYFTEENITLKLNTTVKELVPEDKKVLTDENEEIYYDQLVLATGSKLRTLDIPGSDAEGVFYLRDFEQAMNIKKWVQGKKDVVIVGAGFIGLELASTFSQMGLNVHVIELEEHPLGRILGEDVSHYFVKMHKEHGVQFHLGESIKSFEKDKNGAVAAALTNTGTKIDADIAIIGVGVTPDTSLSHPDLKVERGYVVNEYGETTLPDVYAVGDAAVWPYQDEIIHVEHWEHAYHHGQKVAKNIIEPKSTEYTVRPYFWTDQYDQTFEYFGHTSTWDKTIIRGSLDDREFTIAYADENNYPLALFTANNADKRKVITKFMNENQPINEKKFWDLNNPLNEI